MKTLQAPSDLPTDPIDYARLMARTLGLQERSLGGLMAGTGLEVPDLLNDETLLSHRQLIQIRRNAYRLYGKEGFGLELGKYISPSTHGTLSFLVYSCPDLFTALQRAGDLASIRVSFMRLELIQDEAWLTCKIFFDLEADHATHQHFMEVTSLAILAIVESISGESSVSCELHCAYPEPTYSQLYYDYISCPITFSSQYNGIRIPLEACYAPSATANHSTYEMALKQCQKILMQLPIPAQAGSTQHKVRTLLLSYPQGELNEEATAAELFITKRTLARRLKKEGTGFKQLREEVMITLAKDYLENSGLSIEVIAAQLGYHDGRTFSRAFKRCLSMTPGEYRNRCLSA